jgi:N-acetylneuraminate synthase/sialic acid synthase
MVLQELARREFTISSKVVSDNADAYVIAEIGHNHQGDLRLAEELFRQAAKSGASAAKLQKRHNATLYTKAMYNERYGGRNSYGSTYGAHREALEFDRAEYRHLSRLAAELGIDFIATAFDFRSVDFLADLDIAAIKIASADVTNTPLLTYAAKTGKPLIVSTGGASMVDIQRAVAVILPINDNLALLQCTAIYPCAHSSLNLRVIRTFRRAFPDVVIGFSGHDDGVEWSKIAYALGARVIEKHFTLDRTTRGSDHHFSLEPDHMKELVDGLVRTREALGDPQKYIDERERAAIRKMGKKLVAARDLPAGCQLTEADVAIKSPGDGLPPYLFSDVIGRTLRSPLAEDEDFTLDMLV